MANCIQEGFADAFLVIRGDIVYVGPILIMLERVACGLIYIFPNVVDLCKQGLLKFLACGVFNGCWDGPEFHRDSILW